MRGGKDEYTHLKNYMMEYYSIKKFDTHNIHKFSAYLKMKKDLNNLIY